MPKLLIVTTVAATLRAFLLPYARHFRALGWRVDALSRDTRSCPECLEAFDSCFEAPFSRKPWALRGVRRMGEFIRTLAVREGYDIVHVHTPVAAFVTRRELGRLPAENRPKVVYTAHGFHFAPLTPRPRRRGSSTGPGRTGGSAWGEWCGQEHPGGRPARTAARRGGRGEARRRG